MCFTYCTLGQLYFYMLISVLVIYAWDQCRVLRFTSRTLFAAKRMDTAAMYMMAMPAGVLAGCLVFKAYGMSQEGFLDELRRQLSGDIGVDASMNRFNIFLYVGAGFFG